MKDTFYLNISTADNLGIGLFKYSLFPEEKFIITNSTLVQLLGYSSKKEFRAIKFDNLFLNLSEKEKFFASLRQNEKVKFYETVFKDKLGKNIWVAITASRILTRNKHEYCEGIIEDISAHKKMEEKLFLEREFLQGLLDNIPDMVYFKDLQNRFVLVNKAHAEALHLAPEQVIGKSDLDFFPKELAEKYFADDIYVIKSGIPIVGKIEKAPRADGGITYVSTTKIPHYDKDGKIIGTMGITRNVTVYANLENERLNMFMNTLTVLGKALEMRDPYTSAHTQNVANIAQTIAEELGWDENRILGVKLAGELHDLGKISIPLDILNKPGKLSELEYRLIQEHVKNCYNLIKDIKFPFSLVDTVYQHHERLDGSGYPQGLREDKILLEARILAVCDVLESMTSYRPYREALGLDRALAELENGRGLKYDHRIVKVVFGLVEKNNGKAFWMNN